MSTPKKYDATFQHNKCKLNQKNKEERERNSFIRIFNSNNPDYLIKFYHHSIDSINLFLQESNLNASNSLLKPKQFALKIFDVQLKDNKHFLSMLTESYSTSLKEHWKLQGIAFYFDLLKFMIQAAELVRECDEKGIQLMHLGKDQLVYDKNSNLILANLDFCAETLLKKKNKKGILNLFFGMFRQKQMMHVLAPEIRSDNKFGSKGLIWDIGMLAYEIMTGELPNAIGDEDELGNLKLKFNNVTENNKVNQSLQLLIGNCLVRDPEKRLSHDELIASAVKASEPEIPKIIFNSKVAFLLKMIKSEHPDFEKEINVFDNFIQPGNRKREYLINKFKPKSSNYNLKNFKLSKQVEILLNEKEMVYNKMLKRLVGEGWSNPSSIIKFYDFLVNGLGSVLSKRVLAMKSLVVLHYFIFYGSQNTLLNFLKDKNERNTVFVFLESIIAHMVNQPSSILYRYSYFLYVKINLHKKLSNFLENNFSVAKTKFIMQYGSILSVNNMEALLHYVKFVYGFLVSERKYYYDYYYKLFIISIFNELVGCMGLISNIVVFIRFNLLLFRGDQKSLVKEEYRSISSILKVIIKFLAQVIRGMNAYIVQSKFLGCKEFALYKQTDDIESLYQELTPKMEKVQEDRKNISPKGFTKYFMNSLLKMNNTTGIEEFTGRSSIISKASEFKRGILPLIKKFIIKENNFESFQSVTLDLLPLSKDWYYEYGKTVNSFKDLSILRAKGVPIMMSSNGKSSMNLGSRFGTKKPVSSLISAPTSIPKQQKKLIVIQETPSIPIAVKKPIVKMRSKKTQTDPVIEFIYNPNDVVSLKDKIKERNLLEKKVKRIGEIKETKKEGQLQYYKDPENQDIKLYNQNITYFLELEFEKSVDRWVLEYGDLTFHEIMASGSTCKVYHGYYRNLEVAIKKLNTPNPMKKFRYLKEFKRELGVLISIPKHPNIVALYGFCIYKEEIYLVFEFCQGHTLFDILYRKETKMKMNLKQKLKVLCDIARSIQYLHELKPQLIHRDLKTLNILLDKKIYKDSMNFTAKISDFGLTRLFEANEEFLTKRMGTFHWMAPEVFANKPYSTKSDMYGFAIIMWEIFSQKTPYYHLDDPSAVIKFVFYKGGRPNLKDCKIPKEYEKRIKKLIQRNWDDKPEIRQEFSELYTDLEEIMNEL